MMFVVTNMYLYTTNQELHGVNTRENMDLHLISIRPTEFKEEVYFTGMRINNHLPANIKQLANKTEIFKSVFYSMDEYFNYSGH
jgi:hypothetical protein